MLTIGRCRAALVCLFGISFFVCAAERGSPVQEPFDHGYGRIAWEDEKSRLDTFAIQLLQETDYVGYIFVFNAPEMCPGEAQARAVRAKRYIVEHRGVPWNRVIWKEEGYRAELETTLWIFKRAQAIPYRLFSGSPPPTKLQVKGCHARIAKIRRSKWN